MNPVKLLLATAIWASLLSGSLLAQSTIKKEIDVGFAQMDLIKPILKQSLSPIGKFVMLPNKGSVMVIDTPEGIMAAEAALAQADMPEVDVALDFEFVTGLPPRQTNITVVREVPFPTNYAPPQIIVGPGGSYTVVPATPTQFRKRKFGVISETNSSVNPDGSINLNTSTEVSEFEGFINYGSAILPSGEIGAVPVGGPVVNPLYFEPFINSGNLNLPIISTTRITTSVVIRPRVNLGLVILDVMPRFTVEPQPDIGGQSQRKPVNVDLTDFRTEVEIPNRGVGRVYGFTGASDDFNRRFFGAENPNHGSTAIEVRAAIKPPGTAAAQKAAETPVVPPAVNSPQMITGPAQLLDPAAE
tara:strand:+ start:2270 stop:3343 length:1074 start_codon:yes stop_codon:yes gene_type:complete